MQYKKTKWYIVGWHMKYIFYFDETFHDRKIVLSGNGSINTLRDDDIDDYVGIFWGCERKYLNEYISQLTEFERKYRKIYGLAEGKELKSEIIGKKNYQYGLTSFNKNAFNFYSDLFSLLSKWDFILQINIISKIELLVRNALSLVLFPNCVNKDAFIYSLTKLIVVHKPLQLIKAMETAANGGPKELFRLSLLETLDSILSASDGVTRKEKAIIAFQGMKKTIESIDFQADFKPKTDFEYFPNFEGLSCLLGEIGIKPKEIKITIDAEENTYKAAQNYNFGKIKQGKSESSIQLRLSDYLCGFIGRMLYALKHDEAAQEKELVDINSIDIIDIKQKRLLSPQWFDMKKSSFEMYKLLYETLIVQHEHYWTALTTTYNDDTISFYSLLRYIASYQTFEEFISTSAAMHTEYYNSRAVEELADYYKRI